MTSDNNKGLQSGLPSNPKKSRSLAILSLYGVSILVAGYLLLIGGRHFAPLLFGPGKNGGLTHDSPVEIAGGSIHLCSRTIKIPSSKNGQDWIIGAVDDFTQISTENVENFPNYPAFESLDPISDSWEIHITDGTSDDALTLISKKPGQDQDPRYIVVHTRDKVPAPSSDGKAIILPPDDGSCQNANNCAQLKMVSLWVNGQVQTRGACTNGKCGVYIGTPSKTSKSVCEYAQYMNH